MLSAFSQTGQPGGATLQQPVFLPTTGEEMRALGWDGLDVLLVSGDAYVDHPSFGVPLLGRWLVAHGFRTGIVAQPPWTDRERAVQALGAMGRPGLFTGVAAGALDSMLAHYTAFRKKRHDDAYTPGGLAGARPNRACIAYTGLVRQAFPGMPVVLGGIEASMRRAVHYDFWDDALRRPLLLDSKADILVYGMGETALLDIARTARRLAHSGGKGLCEAASTPRETVPVSRKADVVRHGADVVGHGAASVCHEAAPITRDALREACQDIPGISLPLSPSAAKAFSASRPEVPVLPGHEAILAEPALLMQATLALEAHVHSGSGPVLQYCAQSAVCINAPAPPLSGQDLDFLYSLPYARLAHPSYTEPVPAWEMIRTSITTHRGCGGGCSFCSLALHQGRRIASRSRRSVLEEAAHIAAGPSMPGAPASRPPKWAGSISDVGGPSANMWQASCALPEEKNCLRRSCMHPAICPFFRVDQQRGVELLRSVAAQPGVRHVRVASGVRFDLALQDREALYAYTGEFTGGQLKVAPEHSEDSVLGLMRKPGLAVFERFLEAFAADSRNAGKEQYTIPYLMSAFPGCTMDDMLALGRWLKKRNWSPKQIQCFIPTPGTVATAMFYAGVAPDGSALYVARTDKERLMQHHVLTGPQRQGKGAKPGPGHDGGRRAGRNARNADARSDQSSGGHSGRTSGGRSGRSSGGRTEERTGLSGQGKNAPQKTGALAKEPSRPNLKQPDRRKTGAPSKPASSTRKGR